MTEPTQRMMREGEVYNLWHIGHRAHDNNKRHGWWEDGRTFGDICMLFNTEVAEAYEEWRDGHDFDEHYYALKIDPTSEYNEKTSDVIDSFINNGVGGLSEKEFDHLLGHGILKPEGIPSELADIIIRVMDAVVHYNIDITKAIREKMMYNEAREYRHGRVH